MHSIAWKYSRNVLFPHFNLDCGIEDNSSPGIICIVCDQVLCHPSEHGSSSIGKHLLAKEHIAKFNELTESKVSQLTSTTVDDTALAMWKRQGSWRITIVSLQKKFIFDSLIITILIQLTDKMLQLAAKDFLTVELYQETWNHNLMLRFVSATIPWKAIANLELQQSNNALCSKLALPSACTICIIRRREYSLTVDATKKQLPSRNNVSLALNGWISTNKLVISLFIAYYMHWNWVLWEAQLVCDEADSMFIFYSEW